MDEASTTQEQESDRCMIESKKNRSKKIFKKTLGEVTESKTECCKESPMILVMCPKCQATLRVE